VLGLDYGTKRVGIAVSDSLGLTAQPLEVVASDVIVERVRQLADELDVAHLVVGLPVGLSGREGPSAAAARAFAADLKAATGLPVTLVDERFTTSQAERVMVGAGVTGPKRREKVDKVAATLILQQYLDRRS
jgi:putative Holliday junction resolvase